jgi:hypothetical protein
MRLCVPLTMVFVDEAVYTFGLEVKYSLKSARMLDIVLWKPATGFLAASQVLLYIFHLVLTD